MAITNAQQARQLYQFGGGADAGGKGSPGGGDFGGGGNPGGDGDNRSDRMGSLGKKGPPSGLSDKSRGDLEAMTKGLRSSIAAQNRAAAFGNFKTGLKNIFDKTLIGRGINMLGKTFGPKGPTDPYSGGKTGLHSDYGTTDDDDDDIGGGDGIPLYAQLGYPSQEAYMAAMRLATQPPAGLPAAVQPEQTMDLNRIAYRFMADGGFLDDEDEPRQAYGLGSLVKKVVKKATTLPRKLVKTVKKVAKSPTGRLLLAVAAPYALGPAMAGFSAATRAALISGATTGITQLASGEDLDLKDIAISAALGGATAKMFPPGGSQATGASKAASASKFQLPRGGGADFSQIAASRTGPTPFDIAGPVKGGGANLRSIIPKAKPDTGILQTLKDFGTKVKDSKFTDVLLRGDDGKISPMKSILLASTLSGLAAKKEQEPDEFTDQDRGPGIDIAAIRRRPFDYMAPRFAGSQFDFYDTEAADGGRIGFDDGDTDLSNDPAYKGWVKIYETNPDAAAMNENHERYLNFYERTKNAQAEGSKEPVAKKVMPLLDLDGQEMDLRAEGGFVPIGRMEKADDVPARLSKNEFVFTADAVRNAGDGDVDKGAEVMYNMMKNLESGGDVSEESQGLKGARQMFQTSQRLEEVL